MNSDRYDPKGTQPSWFTTPLSKRGVPIWLVYALMAIGVVYILNPTAGILEILPDNLPIFGNLDEGVAFTMIWFGLMELTKGRRKI